MSSSFTQFLAENLSVDIMLHRMADEVEIVDKGQKDEFVVRDKKMGELTGKEHKFDVRFHGKGDIEVHPHDENDHKRAAALEHHILGTDPHADEEDPRRAKAKRYLDDERKRAGKPDWAVSHQEQDERKTRKIQQSAVNRMKYEQHQEELHGPDWRDKVWKDIKAKTDQQGDEYWDGYAKNRDRQSKRSGGFTGD